MHRIRIVAQPVVYDAATRRAMPDKPGGKTLAQWHERFGGWSGTVDPPGGGAPVEVSLAPLDGL